jgi:plasmid maintenance system antidote protein VapI
MALKTMLIEVHGFQGLKIETCGTREFWLNLQQMHDLSKARLELSKTIERDVEAYAGA